MRLKKGHCANDARRLCMPDISQPVSMSFIVESIAAILLLVAVGIFAVKMGKKEHEKG